METCNCERCGRLCQAAPSQNPDARLLRKSIVPRGVCIDCAVTEFLLNTSPCNWLIEKSGPSVLLHEPIQQQFAQIMKSGMADARPDEIDWHRVVANWSLPYLHVKNNPMNPDSTKHPRRKKRAGS